MAGWDGNGNWSWTYSWANEAALGNPISSAKMDTQFADGTAGFQNCLTRDGQGKPSVDISWNSKKITNLANGTAAADAVNLSQVQGLVAAGQSEGNLLINGGFDVWQAGAGGSAIMVGAAARIRTADCWWAVRAASATGYTVSQVAGEVNRYALKWQRDAGNASTAAMSLGQGLETANSVWLKRASTACYLSFYAKKGANYSGGDLVVSVIRGTGTDENILDGYTGASTLASLVQTLTTTLTRYTLSVPGDASTNEIGVKFSWTPSGVAGADDSVTIENVQLEPSAAAGEFEFLPFDETLRRCQRYFQKSFVYGTAPAQGVGFATPGNHAFFGAFLAGASLSPPYMCPLPASVHPSAAITFYNPVRANSYVVDATINADGTTPTATLSASGSWLRLYFYGNAGTSVGNSLAVSYVIAHSNL